MGMDRLPQKKHAERKKSRIKPWGKIKEEG